MLKAQVGNRIAINIVGGNECGNEFKSIPIILDPLRAYIKARMNQNTPGQPFGNTWRDRLRALRNVPPGLRIVWESGPRVAVAGLALQVLSALIPIGIAWVSAAIIGQVAAVVGGHQPLAPIFWWLVAAEFGLALGGSILSRTIDYCDSVLADKFIRHVSIKVMDHASRLDLQT